MNPRPVPEHGDVVGDTRILKRIGEGASGIVFEGRRDGKTVALKVLKPEVALDEAAVRAFREEARSTGSIRHPNIVRILDEGVDDGLHWILMELVDGPPLDRLLLRRERLPWKAAAKIVRAVAAALDAAHDQGLLHRDVKPGNVLLRRDGTPRLTDFGIAKDIGSLKGYLLKGVRVGTPSYAAPEQCLDRRPSAATDTYGLGATLFHMVCGRPPFVADNPKAILWKHVNAPAPAPRALVPEIPKSLANLVGKMLAKRQAERPPLGRVIKDLDNIIEGRVAIESREPTPRANLAALKGLHRTRIRRTG